MAPPTEFHLYRHAETAWTAAIRPWLQQGHALGRRSWVVVATRGQAQAWKQRCVDAGVALLGVEFLTPGLARQKWLATLPATRPAMGREFLLWGLARSIERRLAGEELDDGDRALLLSLQSDLETALDDYDSLLRSGRSAAAFPWPALQAVFAEVESWVDGLGFDFSPRQASVAASTGEAGQLPGRVLVVGLGPEHLNEYHSVLALAKRASSVTLVFPEPEFRGKRQLDEQWIERWEGALGTTALPLDAPEPESHCGGAVEGWLPDAEQEEPLNWDRVDFRVAPTLADEAEQAVDEVRQGLAAGATSILILTARADLLYLAFRRRLGEAGVAFQDQVGAPGFPSQEAQVQRALVRFWAKGMRWAELLELWPRLWALGATTLPAAEFRRAASRWADATQDPRVTSMIPRLAAGKAAAPGAELLRLAPRLCIEFSDTMTLRAVLDRVADAFSAWDVGLPEVWPQLEGFAEKEVAARPPATWLDLLHAFLDRPAPEAASGAASGFCRVVLSTRRRAEGVPWSRVVLLGANAGVWPERRESSCWLPDEARIKLAPVDGLPPLPTADDRAWLDRCAYARLARDTASRLCLTASTGTPADPEETLSPNSWLERLLARRAAASGGDASLNLEKRFLWAAGARRAAPIPPAAPGRRDGGEGEGGELASWAAVWRGRRDPTRGFDEHFLSVPAHPELGPAAAAARVCEAGLKDPAVLWFETVLKATPVEWGPWVRVRAKWTGQAAHEVLASALTGTVVEEAFGETPTEEQARARALAVIAGRRPQHPADQYWDSCFAELEGLVLRLLRVLYSRPLPPYSATEYTLPTGASVPLGPDGARFGLRGRLDLVLSDRPGLAGARVEIVDFKTGRDAPLTKERMARGESLQLGLYLAAMLSLGAERAEVRMVRPVADDGAVLGAGDLETALARLGQLRRHLEGGRYGALTPEPSEYSKAGYAWPLACTPVPEAVLRAKHRLTFPEEDHDGAD